MSYNCRVYMNTGFNAGNIPASPSILESVATSYRDVAALEILQQRFLPSIRVSATWEQVQDADYVRVGSVNAGAMYYFVTGVTMLNSDTAELSLSLDALTSVGGVNNIKVIDGQTDRWTGVEVGDSDDPLLTPMDAMDIEGDWMFEGSSVDQKQFFECSLDVGSTSSGDGKTFTDQNTGTEVVVPQAKKLIHQTQFRLPQQNSGITRGTFMYIDSDDESGTTAHPNKVNDCVADLRSLGLEDAVISHVTLPSDKVEMPSAFGYDGYDCYGASYLTGKDVVNRTLPIDGQVAPSTVKNYKHINNSDYCKLGLMTCGGESMEFLPKEVDLTDGIRMVSDPNPDGRVYYRFNDYKGLNTLDGFWLNCVSGLPWKQTPLTFNGKSGSAFDYMKSSNTNMLKSIDYNIGRINKGFNMVSNAANTATNIAQLGGFGPIGMGMAAGGTLDYMQGVTSYFTDLYKRDADAYAETREFGYNQIALPTIKFPYNSETLRDLHNNGVYVYQYVYSQSDIARINKLLNRYGKKYVAALTESMLVPQTGENFVYIRANGVSVTHKTVNNIGENWINNEIAKQLEGGVRIWAVSPINGTV